MSIHTGKHFFPNTHNIGRENAISLLSVKLLLFPTLSYPFSQQLSSSVSSNIGMCYHSEQSQARWRYISSNRGSYSPHSLTLTTHASNFNNQHFLYSYQYPLAVSWGYRRLHYRDATLFSEWIKKLVGCSAGITFATYKHHVPLTGGCPHALYVWYYTKNNALESVWKWRNCGVVFPGQNNSVV